MKTVRMLIVLFALVGSASAQELQCYVNEDRIYNAVRELEDRLPNGAAILGVEIREKGNIRCSKLETLAARIANVYGAEVTSGCRPAVHYFNNLRVPSRIPAAARKGKCGALVTVTGFIGDERFDLKRYVFGKWGAPTS